MDDDVCFEFGFACGANLDAMPKRERAWNCRECDRQVFDLSAHTPEEVASLVGARPACVRAAFAADGSLLTRPSASGSPARVWAAVAGAAAALAVSGATTTTAAEQTEGRLSVEFAKRSDVTSFTVVGEGFNQNVVLRHSPLNGGVDFGAVSLPAGTYRLILNSTAGRKARPLTVTVRPNYLTAYDGQQVTTTIFIPQPFLGYLELSPGPKPYPPGDVRPPG